MIRVAEQPAPADFDTKAGNPGRAFLRRSPSLPNFKSMDLWKNALGDLRKAYRGICAYCCFWVPTICSVDHFHPKTSRPELAYDWGNYRLAHPKLNSYKGDSTEVLDPFHIDDGWFTLDLANCFVKPRADLPQVLRNQVTRTIEILRLNTDETLVQQRFDVLRDYSKGYPMEILEERYPFIASELRRQNLQDTIRGTIA
ncbi:MAG: hypothetical protein ACRD3L_09175 [Terriglobales bacterium]